MIPCSKIDKVTITKVESHLWREFLMTSADEQEPTVDLAGYTGPAIRISHTAGTLFDNSPRQFSLEIPCREPDELLHQLNQFRKPEIR